MIRVARHDAYSLGLLYAYLYSNKEQRIVSEQALEKFYRCIETNLEEMKSKLPTLSRNYYAQEENIYNYTFDEKGKKYYSIKDDFNLNDAIGNYIGLLSFDIIKAAQMDNALDTIGLAKVDENIMLKKYISELKPKAKVLKKKR